MIALRALVARAGQFRIGPVSLEVPAGCYGVLMGRTGSGKTTLIEAICGLRRVESGGILIGDVDVVDLPPRARGLGYVPQDGALFQHMSVREHLAFAPRVRGWTAADVARRVDELAAALGIAALLDRLPQGLSGGERQRVALGRALAARPPALLLDEPLSALDEDTHAAMVDLLRRVNREQAVTVLHITHSRREAQALGDVVARIEAGAIVVEREAAAR